MLLSMTGYGKAECLIQDKKYTIELRSLNSKQMDLTLRVAPLFREKELDIRALLTQALERGKAEAVIYETHPDNRQTATAVAPVNTEALNYYVEQLSAYAAAKGLQTDVLAIAMQMPDVTRVQEQANLSDDDWQTLQDAIAVAIERFNAFRKQEGTALQNMFTEKLTGISALLEQVEPLEKERIEKIRGRLEDNLRMLSEETRQSIDGNRLEQEMIYYLEKLDITEEKVRLRNHIRYFFETMNDEKSAGKKLGFVAQEMGREINTLGSKSNHSEMQILVVKMKDILEQIKEQVLNVL